MKNLANRIKRLETAYDMRSSAPQMSDVELRARVERWMAVFSLEHPDGRTGYEVAIEQAALWPTPDNLRRAKLAQLLRSLQERQGEQGKQP